MPRCVDQNTKGLEASAGEEWHLVLLRDSEASATRLTPNFVLDVFPGDDLLDYEYRRDCFEHAQLLEYVAVQHTDPVEWIWNRLIDGRFSVIKAADNELIMSTALPGLWVPAHALRHRDWWSVMEAIARGVTRVGHHDFMDTIWKPDQNRT